MFHTSGWWEPLPAWQGHCHILSRMRSCQSWDSLLWDNNIFIFIIIIIIVIIVMIIVIICHNNNNSTSNRMIMVVFLHNGRISAK